MVFAIWLASEPRPLFWGKTLLGTTKVQHAHSRAPCPGHLYRGFMYGAAEQARYGSRRVQLSLCVRWVLYRADCDKDHRCLM